MPALRIEYTFRGNYEHRVYTRCLYLALDGSWHDLRRAPYELTSSADCPVIRSFPFNILKELL